MPVDRARTLRFDFVTPLEIDVDESEQPNVRLEVVRDALGTDRRWTARVASIRTDPASPQPHVVVWVSLTGNDPTEEIRTAVATIVCAGLPNARLLSVESLGDDAS